MEISKLAICLERVHPRQGVYLNFIPGNGSIPGVKTLLESTRNPAVMIDTTAKMLLMAVTASGRWEDVSRTAMVYGLVNATSQQLGIIANTLESVSAGEHFAKALFTSNKPKQAKAADQIVNEVLNEVLHHDVGEWELRATGELVEIDSLPAIKFTLYRGSLPIVRISLDGWSGRWKIGAEDWSDQRCTKAETIRTLITQQMEMYLSKATAPA